MGIALSGDIIDPATNQLAQCRKIQPYQANKPYLCPECNFDIRPGEGHFVVVPHHDHDARRHWHERCLTRALNREVKSNRSKGRRKRSHKSSKA